jgi:hypothetical protein
MKKNVIILISTILIAISVNLSAQNPHCKWEDSPPRFSNFTDNIILNEGEGCNFRLVLKDPMGAGWGSGMGNSIVITVDGIDFGSVTLPWGTPFKEEIRLLPSGEVQFFWTGDFSYIRNCFEIYNSYEELIFESPYLDGLDEGLFLTYQNICPDCFPLTNFEGEYIQEIKQINLSWIAPESKDFTGFDIFRNDIIIEHVDATTNFYSSHTDSLEDGVYKFCVLPVYPFLCAFDEECYETYISNVGVKDNSSAIRLYPNPTNNIINISEGDIAVVKVFDIIGQLVNRYENVNQINVSSYKEGVYLFNIITTKNEISVFKVIVTK